MQNIKYEIKKDLLTIEIDLKQRCGVSKSGKSETIATTGGNLDIGKDGIKIGINCYIKAEAKAGEGGKK